MHLEEFRTEQDAAVAAAVAEAFGTAGEAALVRALRQEGAVAVELVAVDGAAILGHVLFSRLTVEPAELRVAALAPVSVPPHHQRKGIGSALIREGLARCAGLGFDAAAVLGEPDYYGRFGFSLSLAERFSSVYSGHYFQVLELRLGALHGGRWNLTYPAAFGLVD